MKGDELKEKTIFHCTEIYQQRLVLINKELKHLSQAIADDTKSSAGDKYETSREMANLEKGKLQSQVQVINRALATLDSMPANNERIIGHGTLIKTDQNWILIAVSLGEVKVNLTTVLVISSVAPLAQLLLNKVTGDQVAFGKNTYKIISIF